MKNSKQLLVDGQSEGAMHSLLVFFTNPLEHMHPGIHVATHKGFPLGFAQVDWQSLFPQRENISFDLGQDTEI